MEKPEKNSFFTAIFLIFSIMAFIACGSGKGGGGGGPKPLALEGEIAGPTTVTVGEIFTLTATLVGSNPTYDWRCVIANSSTRCSNLIILSSDNTGENFHAVFSELPDGGTEPVNVTFITSSTASPLPGVPAAGDISRSVRVEPASAAELSVSGCDLEEWNIIREKVESDASYTTTTVANTGDGWCRVDATFDDHHNPAGIPPWHDFQREHPVTLFFDYTEETFSPASVGGITGVQFIYDVIIASSNPGNPGTALTLPLIIQGDRVYVGMFHTEWRTTTLMSPIEWSTKTTRTIPKDDFIEVVSNGDSLDSLLGWDGGGTFELLDWSAEADSIRFGIMIAIYSSDIGSSDTEVSAGFANLTVRINGPISDVDNDGVLDIEDNCPIPNPEQEDSDNDGIGDACQDSDGDGIPDVSDNCPDRVNATQADRDGDGAGDLCEECPDDPDKTEPGTCGCGSADSDADNSGIIDCQECSDVSGTWELVVTGVKSSCGNEIGWNSDITINQTGCTLMTTGIKDTSFIVNGSASGDTVTIGPGNFPEGSGTTNATYTMTIQDDGSMSGTESWSWKNGFSCVNGSAQITATRN